MSNTQKTSSDADRPLTMTTMMAALREIINDSNAKFETFRHENRTETQDMIRENRKEMIEMIRELRKEWKQESEPVQTSTETVDTMDETDFVSTENSNSNVVRNENSNSSLTHENSNNTNDSTTTEVNQNRLRNNDSIINT